MTEPVVDLRWVVERLCRGGVPVVLTDLALVDDPVAARLARAIGRVAHLLPRSPEPSTVGRALVNVLATAPDLAPLVDAYLPALPAPHLVHRWPVTDLVHPAVRRILHTARSPVLAVSPDGTWLATAGHDGSVRIWDTATGGPLAALDGHKGAVTALAVAADESWLASAGADNTVRVWDPAGEALPRTLSGVDRQVTALAAAPDGTLALADDRCVWVHDLGQQAPPRRLAEHAGRITAMAFGPDGTWLVTLAADGSVRVRGVDGQSRTVVDPATPDVLRRRDDPFTTLAVAPDGTWMVIGALDRMSNAEIRDVATGAVRATLTGDGYSRPMSAAIAADGSWIAVGSAGSEVRVWDAATGEQRAVLSRNGGNVTAIAIAPDDSWLAAAGSTGEVHVWDAGGTPVEPLPYVSGAEALAVASDGTQVLAAVGRTVERRRTTDGTVLSTVDFRSGVRALAVAPDGTWFAAADHDEVGIWDVRTGTKKLTLAGRVEYGRFTDLALAPDGSWLVAVDSGDTRWRASSSGQARIWDTTTGELRATLTGDLGEVLTVAVAPDGTWLATAGTAGGVCVWDVATWSLRTSVLARMHRVNSVVIAPDGDWMAHSGSFEDIWFFDAATGADRARINTKLGKVEDLAVSPDGTRLAVAAWEAIQVWDVATRKLEVSTRLAERVNRVAWLPDGSGLCVAGRAGVHLLR